MSGRTLIKIWNMVVWEEDKMLKLCIRKDPRKTAIPTEQISLLDVTYRIVARMIKKRLEKYHNE